MLNSAWIRFQKFVERYYLPWDRASYSDKIDPVTFSRVPQGLYLRVKYHSVSGSTSAPDIIIKYVTYRILG